MTAVMAVTEVLVNGLSLLDFVREVPLASNRGPFISAALLEAGAKEGDPWCAAGLTRAGKKLLKNRWPVPNTASCTRILEWARVKGILYIPQRTLHVSGRSAAEWVGVGGQIGEPLPGDIGLRMKGLREAHHTFVVDRPNADGSCATWECNTNNGASAEGVGVFQLTRGKADDRHVYTFARWASLVEGA